MLTAPCLEIENVNGRYTCHVTTVVEGVGLYVYVMLVVGRFCGNVLFNKTAVFRLRKQFVGRGC